MYRVIGKYVVDQGQQTAIRVIKSRTQGAPSPAPVPMPPETEPPQPPPPPSEAQAPPPPPPPASAPVDSDASSGNGQRPPTPSSDDLAIPGYDALSALQVVQRLAGLEPDELEAVRAYEAATRGRKTILSRVAQLQTGG
jgi:hypothetical protein